MNRTSTTSAESRTQQERREHGLDVSRLREVSKNLGGQIEEQVQKRPYVVIGAAAGIGFVAGSLFGSRLGQMLLAAGLGYIAKNLVAGDIDVERLQEKLEELSGERSTAE
ncbi:MAG TPA: DUF883 C-terminal domain-containing protein [Polyangiaceae bacterium]|nr:DUF883 C-terminal domain-containing protein [Polyangiaceae bacterium]